MKKLTFIVWTLFMLAFEIQASPAPLHGIWIGKDRIIFIGSDDEFSVIMKLYYGWYYDTAAESDSSLISTERKNAASARQPQIPHAEFVQIVENVPAYEIKISFGGKKSSAVPTAVLDNELYLNFLIKKEESSPSSRYSLDGTINGADISVSYAENEKEAAENQQDSIYGYWQGINSSRNIQICTDGGRNDIYSWYILKDSAYRLRFWKTDIPYEHDSTAAFTDGENIFSIKKHIYSGEQNYTCATGRSTRIRNVEKFREYPQEYKLDSSRRLLVYGKPDFIKADVSSRNELERIIREANSRRKPEPPALFPQKELDWHLDLINELEKDNKIIEEVRKRQKDFETRIRKTDSKE